MTESAVDKEATLPVDWRQTGLKGRRRFAEQVRRMAELQDIKSQAEAEYKSLKDEMELELVKVGVDAVSVDERWSLRIIKQAGRERLDKARLLELGVTPRILQKATIVGKPSEYLRMVDVTKERKRSDGSDRESE